MSNAKWTLGTEGLDQGNDKLEQFRRKLDDIADSTAKLSGRYRDLNTAFEKQKSALSGVTSREDHGPGALAKFAKIGADILASNAKALAQATMAPGMSSYGGMIEGANRWRQSTQQIATASGKSFEQIGQQVLNASKTLGISEQRVQTYGRSVRSLTGDWASAMGGIGAYQSRALQTDRTLEEMIPIAADLTNLFGVSSEQQIASFFGTLDAQAQKAQISGARAERTYAQFAQTLSGINGSIGQRSGLALAFQKGAITEDVGNRAFGGFMGMVRSQRYGIEAAMRAKGALSKGEHLFDERTGQWDINKMAAAADFIPGYMSKFYGAKNRGDALEKIGRIQFGGDYEAAAQLLNIKPGDVRAMMATQGIAPNTSVAYLATDAGKREAAESNKSIKDRVFGASFLGAQDAAVTAGGGAAGLAMAQSIATFEKASGIFWESVKLFAGATAASGGGTAAAVAGGGTVATVARVGLTRAVPLAGVVTMEGDTEGRNRFLADKQTPEALRDAAIQEQRDHLAKMEAGGISGWAERTFGLSPERSKEEINRLQNMTPQELAEAFGKALDGKVLKTQQIPSPAAPPSQGQPL